MGKYQDAVMQADCKTCSEGKWSNTMGASEETSCVDCSAGKYSSAKGASAESDCNGCPPGKASSETGNTDSAQCISCTENTVAEMSGLTACNSVAAGKIVLHGGAAAVQVPEGSYITNSYFLACPAGWVGTAPATTKCTACEPGSASTSGAVSCAPCEAGKFASLQGSPNCSTCAIELREYSDIVGADACKTCTSVQSSIGTQCTAIPIDASLKSPTQITIQRINAETFTQLKISWSFDNTQTSADVAAFTLQLSTNSEFHNIPNATLLSNDVRQVILPTINMADIRTTVHYVKIRSIGTSSTQVSEWSATSAKWRNIHDNACNLESQYLNTSSLDPLEWDCYKCPLGGSCSGSLTFENVDAMFGWSQCPSSAARAIIVDNNNTKKFARCMYAPSCLGGTNNELIGKFETNGMIINSQSNSSSNIADPALCRNNNCIAECSKGYANGSRLCGQCAYNYSHDGLSGECKLCPPFEENVGVAALGLLCGILGLVVLIQLTLSDGGTLDESDGAKVC